MDILSLHAASRGQKTALIGPDRTLTYAEYEARANRTAQALTRLGAQEGDRVAVMSFNSVQGYEVSAAARKLGLVAVPINFRLRGAEVAHVVGDSGARIVLADADHAAVVDEARELVAGELTCVAFSAERRPDGWLAFEELLAASGEELAGEPEGALLGASMIYTSGTTGNPKGAFRAKGVGVEAALQAVQIFGLTESDVHLVGGPGYHSAVAFFSALTVLLGGTVVVMPRFDPEAALRLVESHGVTTSFMAPTLLRRICDLPSEARERHDVSSLRAIILGAAPCPYELKQRAVALFGETLWEFYGATETGIQTVLRPEHQLLKPGSCGQAVEGQEILLLDADGNPVPDGEPGQLWARNPQLAEYFENPTATAKAMREGFFTVGDIAYRDSEGFYYICDRQVDMIISGGVNIYPAEVEAVLHAHPAVADVAVIGVPDSEWGESVKAAVQLKPAGEATEPDLIAFCAERLAGYKKPRSIDFVDELPRDAAGKLLKRRIRAPYWEGAGRTI